MNSHAPMVLTVTRPNDQTLACVFLFAAVFLASLLLLAISAEKRQLPASAACIAVGVVVGAILWPTGLADALTRIGVDIDRIATFDRSTFYCSRPTSNHIHTLGHAH